MICEFCTKCRMSGNRVSHSNIKTRRVQKGNMQRIRAVVANAVRPVTVCTRCLRSGKVQKAPPRDLTAVANKPAS